VVDGSKEDRAALQRSIPPLPVGEQQQQLSLKAFYDAARSTVKTTARFGQELWSLGERRWDDKELLDALRSAYRGRTVFVLPWRLNRVTGLTLTDSPLVALSGVLYDEHGAAVWAAMPKDSPHERHVHASTWKLLPDEAPEGEEKIKFVRRVHEGNTEPNQ